MLSCLSHNTISSSNNKDTCIHLSSTCDHVLYIISMSWTVNVCIVSLLCLILNVSCRDSDTSFSFLWCLINILECNSLTCTKSLMKSLCDSSCKCCLTMVNVSDCTNVYMGLTTVKFFFCHWIFLLT